MDHTRTTLVSIALSAGILAGCSTVPSKPEARHPFPAFFKEGHRGARGLMPENTIPSMKKAIDAGANVLELDIHLSRDKQVLVAHDPYINRVFSLMPDGTEIPVGDEKKYILYQMDYSEIREFDVGSKKHSNFVSQKNLPAWIPTLGELIDSVEAYTEKGNIPSVIYNVEIKSNPEQDGYYQPAPEELISRVMEVMASKDIGDRYYIQSFDIRQIQEVHRRYPDVATGFLTSDKSLTVEEQLKRIGFRPDIYSPHYSLATPELVRTVQALGMKFIPWTVNTLDEMKELRTMGVDGIITDYPDLLEQLPGI